jgi:hypothetical protein
VFDGSHGDGKASRAVALLKLAVAGMLPPPGGVDDGWRILG